MSELTQCNSCSLKGIKSDARKKGAKVTILNDGDFGLGGVNVYTHPKEIKIAKLSKSAREKYFKAWFMELTTHCIC